MLAAKHRTTDLGADRFALRPQGKDDREFLLALFASVREAELAVAPWPDDVKRRFLADQFRLQEAHYQAHYPRAGFDIVMLGDQPIGRFYVHRGLHDFRIIDISLLNTHRGQGIGSALLRSVLAKAKTAGRTVSLHVDQFNPAQRLYRRLGFVPVETVNEVYLKMLWRNSPPKPIN